jgi:3',5'-cyclic AMP phosphodiesterase CpdA
MNRRRFLQTSAAALFATRVHAASPKAFSFLLLGDLHFDKPEHHDFEWMKDHSPDSVRQSANYSRLTKDIMPRLFATVRETIAERSRGGVPVSFVLQVGDLVEGLCGNEELAAMQNREALEFVRDAGLGVPFLFTKGNHDVTGPGSQEVYRSIFHPFLTEQVRTLAPGSGEVKSGAYTTTMGNAQFAFFDAYDAESLAWFESLIAARTAEHLFVVIHPPVVPYGARSTWNLYSSAKDQAKREKLLDLLGRQEAFVLGGHIHKYNEIARAVGKGRFAQLAVSSVVNDVVTKAKDELSGVEQYNGDQIRVEPKHSPDTELLRRAVYEAERPFVKAFEYADLPGYAVVTVHGGKVTAEIFAGVSKERWRVTDLVALRAQAA